MAKSPVKLKPELLSSKMSVSIEWKPKFFFTRNLFQHKIFHPQIVYSAIFGTDKAKFFLTASILKFRASASAPIRRKIAFYVNFESGTKMPLVFTGLQYREVQNNAFKSLPNDKLLHLHVPLKFHEVFVDKNAHQTALSAESGVVTGPTIVVKMIFSDKEVSNDSNSWNILPKKANFETILREQLAAIKEDSKFADMTIRTVRDGREFLVHSVILAMRSPVFAVMFSDNRFKENQQKRIDIEDMDGNVMEAFLAYIYGDKIQNWKTFAGELATAADKYDIKALLEVCQHSLSADVNVQTAAKNFFYASQLGLEDSLLNISKFILKHKAEVMSTDGWAMFIEGNPDLLVKLFKVV